MDSTQGPSPGRGPGAYNRPVRTLVIDPDPASRDALRRVLTERGEQARSVETLAEGRRLVAEFAPDVVVVALDVPAGEESALAFLGSLAHSAPAPDAFALVAEGDLEAGVRAMRSGAADFLWRPVSENRVALLFERLAARRVRASAVEDLRIKLARVEMRRTLPGSSPRWATASPSRRRSARPRAQPPASRSRTGRERWRWALPSVSL